MERGQKNGVEGLRILNREEVLDKEKNLTTVVGALWAVSYTHLDVYKRQK